VLPVSLAFNDFSHRNCCVGLNEGAQRQVSACVVQPWRRLRKQPPLFNLAACAETESHSCSCAQAEQGQTDDALICYEMSVNFNPKCAEAFNNLGVIYKDKCAFMTAFCSPYSTALVESVSIRGNLDKSIFYYQEALKANPNFAQVHLAVLGFFEDSSEPTRSPSVLRR
jgi:tetratricopeptide (TPR) repeat protein